MTDSKKHSQQVIRDFLRRIELPPANHTDKNFKFMGLLSVMLQYANDFPEGATEVTCSPALAQLAELLHCEPKTIYREIDLLCKLGIVVKRNRGQKSSEYTIRQRGHLVSTQETGHLMSAQNQIKGTLEAVYEDTSPDLSGHSREIAETPSVLLKPIVRTPSVLLCNTNPLNKISLNKTKARAFALPDWIPTESWQGFVELREKKRKPLTDRAVSFIVGKLAKLREKGQEAGKVLDQSVEGGWTGVFPLRQDKNECTGKLSPRATFHDVDYTKGLEGFDTGGGND